MASGYSATLTVKPKSMTLNRDDVLKLWNIVNKAIDKKDKYWYGKIIVRGKKESVQAKKVSDFFKARWPSSIENIELSARGNEKSIDIDLCRDGLLSYNRILVSGANVDWVNGRVKELEDFISDHRNIHWIFQNWFSVIIQAISLFILAIRVINNVLNISDSLKGILSGLLPLIIIGLYFGLAKLYPFVYIDDKSQDSLKVLRNAIYYIIGLCFAGLISALIAKAF